MHLTRINKIPRSLLKRNSTRILRVSGNCHSKHFGMTSPLRKSQNNSPYPSFTHDTRSCVRRKFSIIYANFIAAALKKSRSIRATFNQFRKERVASPSKLRIDLRGEKILLASRLLLKIMQTMSLFSFSVSSKQRSPGFLS